MSQNKHESKDNNPIHILNKGAYLGGALVPASWYEGKCLVGSLESSIEEIWASR